MSVLELYLVYLGAKVRVAALLLLAGRLLAHPGQGAVPPAPGKVPVCCPLWLTLEWLLQTQEGRRPRGRQG